jgi:queuine tRNA-ribosyltransferase
LFDCVIPTRLARHGKVLTGRGDFNINQKQFESDETPIDPECDCQTCERYSKSYLRHLIRMKELSSHRLLTIHNLHYTLDLIRKAGEAIDRGGFRDFKEGVERLRADESQ